MYGKDENWRAISVRWATSNSTHQVAASTKFEATRSGSHHLHLLDRYFSCMYLFHLFFGEWFNTFPYFVVWWTFELWLRLDLEGSYEYLTTHFYPNFGVSGYELGLEGLLGMMILMGRGKNGALVLNSSPLIDRTAKFSTSHNRDPVLKNNFICLFIVHRIISVSHHKYDF